LLVSGCRLLVQPKRKQTSNKQPVTFYIRSTQTNNI
jgi:hypothetical protein